MIVVLSMKKGAFIVGASYGRGVMVCRSGENFTGAWSAPAMFALEGASFGFQAGGEATDYVILVMNDKGARSVMSSKVKLGGEASVAAGPVGRTSSAETDVALNAEMLSWSRSKGVFGGVSLAAPPSARTRKRIRNCMVRTSMPSRSSFNVKWKRRPQGSCLLIC